MEVYRSGHNGPHSKCGNGATRSWVRIPPLPPTSWQQGVFFTGFHCDAVSFKRYALQDLEANSDITAIRVCLDKLKYDLIISTVCLMIHRRVYRGVYMLDSYKTVTKPWHNWEKLVEYCTNCKKNVKIFLWSL